MLFVRILKYIKILTYNYTVGITTGQFKALEYFYRGQKVDFNLGGTAFDIATKDIITCIVNIKPIEETQ